jgi:hypothetical protein
MEDAVNFGKKGVVTLGIATALPIAWMVIFLVGFFGLVLFAVAHSGAAAGSGPPLWFLTAFLLHFCVMLLIFALTVFYIVDVFQSNRVSADKKALWAVVLFLGNIFAMPVYWYLYLWRPLSVRKSDAQASPQSAS